MPSAENVHAKQFKNTNRHEDMRRRRAETSVELRKQKKEEQLMKRRNVDTEEEPVDSMSSPEQQTTSDSLSLEECLRAFHGDGSMMLQAVSGIRRILSRQQQPPIDEVMRSGAIPFLIKALANPSTKVQFEAAWALTNIVSGTSEQTWSAVKAGIIPPMVALIASSDREVSEQATWCIGNILGDCAHLRDQILAAGALDILLKLAVMGSLSVTFMRTLTWTLSNMGRHRNPPVAIDVIQKTLPVMTLLMKHEDYQVRQDATWSLSYISDGDNERIAMVVDADVIPELVKLLCCGDYHFVCPALRALGNIVTGDDAQTQAVIDSGLLLLIIPTLLQCEKANVRKEATWLISNIAAGTTQQIQSLICANIMPLIIGVLEKGDYRTQVEAAWTLANYTSGASTEQTAYLVSCGCISPICNLLESKEAKLVSVLMDALTNILGSVERLGTAHIDQVCQTIEECGGLDKIELLQQHENHQIYHQALSIIEHYFSPTENDDIDPAIMAEISGGPVADGAGAGPGGDGGFQAPQVPSSGFNFE